MASDPASRDESSRGLRYARWRMINKGVDIGSSEFRQILNLQRTPSDRITVYQSWADACLDAQNEIVKKRKHHDLGPRFAEENRRVKLAASKEFPEVKAFHISDSDDKDAVPVEDQDRASSVQDTMRAPQQLDKGSMGPDRKQLPVKAWTLSHISQRSTRELSHPGHVSDAQLSAHSAGATPKQTSSAARTSPGDDVVQGGNVPAPSGVAVTGDDAASDRHNLAVSKQLPSPPRIDNLGAAAQEPLPDSSRGQGDLTSSSSHAPRMAVQPADLGTDNKKQTSEGNGQKTVRQPGNLEHTDTSVTALRSHRDTIQSVCEARCNITSSASAEGATGRACSGIHTDSKLGLQPAKSTDVGLPPVPDELKPSPAIGNQAGHGEISLGGSHTFLPLPRTQPSVLKVQESLEQEKYNRSNRDADDQSRYDGDGHSLGTGADVQQPVQAAKKQKIIAQPVFKAHVQQGHNNRQLAPMPTRQHAQPKYAEERVHDLPLQEDADWVVVNGVRYAKLANLGRGGSSRVYRVSAPNKNQFALKRVSMKNMPDKVRASYRKEVALLKQLEGTGIAVKVYDSYEYRKEEVFFAVLEIGDCDLDSLLKSKMARWREKGLTDPFKADPNFICSLWQDMLRIVQVLHENARVVHSDLKPANFLIAKGQLKLIDFGIANSCGTDTTSVNPLDQGTLSYMSPEAVARTGRVSRSSDVWSLGCILYSIAYGKLPFDKFTNLGNKVNAIMHEKIDFGRISRSDVLDVLKRCLDRSPDRRATVSELLQHPYLHATAGGQMTQQEMWEMHLAIVEAPPHSLGTEDSKSLFQKLQKARNLGDTISAKSIVHQYLQKRPGLGPPVTKQSVAVPEDDDALPTGVVRHAAGDQTTATCARASETVCSTEETHGHEAGLMRLTVKVGSSRAPEDPCNHRIDHGDEAGEHASAGSSRVSGRLGNAGAVWVTTDNAETVAHNQRNGNMKDGRVGMSQIARTVKGHQQGPMLAGDVLNAKLKAIQDAHAMADEGLRMSVVPE